MLTSQLTQLLSRAFEESGYQASYGDVVVSARPDLCQFQCNGAMPAAKEYKKAPFMISDHVIETLKTYKEYGTVIEEAITVKPGFINIKLTDDAIAQNTAAMASTEHFGIAITPSPETIVLDYGGPNIAKPLHVGHLRTAIIGESLKRLLKYLGHNVISDIHLGDWGLQMGMIISEIERTQPNLPYFSEDHKGDYPSEAPFTLTDLEEIYPRVSALCKNDETIYNAAKEATYKLQNGHPGYRALWKHIVTISLTDIKRNYQRLNVDFDLWYGESNSQDYIDTTLALLQEKGALRESDGALVVDVTRPDDKKELPPMILVKSDGSVIYGTTDLATLYQRVQDFSPTQVLYVVDSRQSNHFTQVFRCASDHGIVSPHVSLEHIGFGTMNGKDGKPFKTRDGGILRLSELIDMVKQNAKDKIIKNVEDKGIDTSVEDIDTISDIVGLATLKYADLSNYRLKDYVFDLDKFSSFEGKTGPYILYSTVRIKNIIRKLKSSDFEMGTLIKPSSDVERNLMLKLDQLESVLKMAARDRSPNLIAEYVYELATMVSSFYHQHHILNETNLEQKKSWYSLLTLTLNVQTTCLDLLGIIVPEKM